MTRYAAKTRTSADRSRAEIERILERYGANKYAYGWDDDIDVAVISFQAHGRTVRFKIQMPGRHDSEFTQTATGRDRTSAAAQMAWEQATRQRWRALCLIIKAKLEAIESGISTFQEEFLAWTLLPNSQTVAEFILPQVDKALEGRTMPPLLAFSGNK